MLSRKKVPARTQIRAAGMISAGALLCFISAASAQQTAPAQTATQPAQTATQPSQAQLQSALASLKEAQTSFSQANKENPGDLSAAQNKANSALTNLQSDLQQNTSSQAQTAMTKIKAAQQALSEYSTSKNPQTVAEALQAVEQNVQPLQTAMATKSEAKPGAVQPTEKPKTAEATPPATQTPPVALPGSIANLPRGEVVGKPIYGSNGTDLGKVRDVVTAPGGHIASALVRVGQFLGFGGKTIAVPAEKLQLRGDRIVSQLTTDEMENLPPHQGQ